VTTPSLPPIDQSLLPGDVRAGGTKSVQLYETALAFESVLDQQLTQALTDTMKPVDGSDADAATSMTLQLLPQALSQQLASAGGLGLAPALYRSLAAAEGTS